MMLKTQQVLCVLSCTYLSVVNSHPNFIPPLAFWRIRGGDIESQSTSLSPAKDESTDTELSLDDKVQNALKKLGLTDTTSDNEKTGQCESGVCEIPPEVEPTNISSLEDATKPLEDEKKPPIKEGPHAMAERIVAEMGVTKDLAMAALGATAEKLDDNERKLDETAARALIQQELNLISSISEDREEVKQLVSEGHELFHARRALVYAEGNMENARAILEADKIDAAEEEDERKKIEEETEAEIQPELTNIDVDPGFDPVTNNLPSAVKEAPKSESPEDTTPPPEAKKTDVVFEATASQIQDLVLESPVPVLLDAYAPWCGPCKALTPALEEMAVKAGGAFRLVKVNTDNEKAISAALEVTALPTVFAIRDGKILNNFQGMPRDEEMIRNFMMGLLMPGDNFKPPVSDEQKKKFAELSNKLVKTAGSAGFSFVQRELLQTRMASHLDNLVDAYDGDMSGAEESAKIVRSLLSNVIRDPYDTKYRKLNLQNKKIAALITVYPPCLAMLKNVGFVAEESGDAMYIGAGKRVINTSRFTVARDCIEKWIDKNRHDIAVATRKRKDEAARLELAAAAAEEDDEEDVEDNTDVDAVFLKVRFEGKKKVHELKLDVEDSLKKIFDSLPYDKSEENYQITCVAKRLIVKSNDVSTLSKSLRSLGLAPSASLVIKIGNSQKGEPSKKLKERLSEQKKLKRGSHTMQSIGVYAKDDNAKGELVDGGGGTVYEQDVTDDEEEDTEKEDDSLSNTDTAKDD
mmetsp:Transcript_30691/g.34981  ORF Transcript_30691/g.34981 Transcript_30691/m.34981 type:complete len:750 (-) Transcript_30691:24-2273(-)